MAGAAPDLAQAARRAADAVRVLVEALRPRTEQEYRDWLRHNDPLGYVAYRRARRRRDT